MTNTTSRLLMLIFLLFSTSVICQDTDRKIDFPNIDGFLSLKTDFHIHTVFSDGSVWPNIRIQEAVADGLDAISLTEHLEYQPHIEDIPHPDRNRSYDIAKEAAKPHDLIIIHGAEITRDMPPGHANAIFIKDANKLLIEDPIKAYEEANRQGAFVFWNHPDWIRQNSDGVAKMTEMHELLVSKKLLHGVEVVNDLTYSEEALQLAQDQGLVPIGTSDIHGLIDYQYNLMNGGHRPITLVFAKERTEQGIKEALFAGRTVSWYDNILVGNEEWLNALLKASLTFSYEDYIGPSEVLQVKIINSSDAKYLLKNNSKYSLQKNADVVEILPHSEKTLFVRTLKTMSEITMDFEVMNAIIGIDKHPIISAAVKKAK